MGNNCYQGYYAQQSRQEQEARPQAQIEAQMQAYKTALRNVSVEADPEPEIKDVNTDERN